MDTIDLSDAVPVTITLLEQQGERVSLSRVLESLGVALLRTLPPEDPKIGAAARRRPMESSEGPSAEPTLGRFTPQQELGRGGMGRVLEALDPDLRRSVAVKVILDKTRTTRRQLERFVAEAQITSQLAHPNIVPVYEMGISSDGDVFFAMKKVEGRSLRQVLQALREGDESTCAEWPRSRLLTAFVKVCDAAAYAHDQGVLHRDIKPGNIMLGAFGEVLLLDWGVARVVDHVAEHGAAQLVESVPLEGTMDGTTVGTPGFMSPEQARGAIDERSDVWSLGAVLYQILTLVPAYSGPNVFNLMYQLAQGPPPDPRERAPARNIPRALGDICLRAMASEPDDRFSTAVELAQAVEHQQMGSARRAAALENVAEAEAIWTAYSALAAERSQLAAREAELLESIPLWAPLTEKEELRSVRRRLASIGPDRARGLSEVLGACDRALSHDPDNPEARAMRARVHFARFEEAEASRDEEDALFHRRRVLDFDDGRYGALLRGVGAVTLTTDPPGAEVICERYDTTGDLQWPLVDRRTLGTTPLLEVALDPGSYLLTLRSPGKQDCRYPVSVPRGYHWHCGDEPIPLFTDAEIGPDFAYVPAGPFVLGGDDEAQDRQLRQEPWQDGFFISRSPVTMREYCVFLTALAGDDPDAAWARVPRQESGLEAGGGQYWGRPNPGVPYRVPEQDRDGDRWYPHGAVLGISWYDAIAYADWRSSGEEQLFSLPLERQWEKAARGVDGRIFPWGDGFDPTMCKMRWSRPGRAQPEPVGAFPADVSPYGVRDLAGGMRGWCADVSYAGDRQRRPLRGGCWDSAPRICRTTFRTGLSPASAAVTYGFRLTRSLPRGRGDS